jgi:hypothetical protein
MIGRNIMREGLTKADFRQAFFLTLALTLVFSSHHCRADGYGTATYGPTYTPEEKQQINDIETYVRKEALHGVTILPGEMRSAVGWLSGGWHSVHLSSSDDEAEAMPQAATAPAPFAQESAGGSDPVNLASNFHHKGFLPTHDAMVMGMGVSRAAFDNKLQFTAHPFYGQNWRALQGYWGTELTMDIAQRSDGMPWGKISLGYVGGNDSLTDHGRGMDLHGDVDLTEGWKLTSGMRQDSATGDSNYVMLRWHMGFD